MHIFCRLLYDEDILSESASDGFACITFNRITTPLYKLISKKYKKTRALQLHNEKQRSINNHEKIKLDKQISNYERDIAEYKRLTLILEETRHKAEIVITQNNAASRMRLNVGGYKFETTLQTLSHAHSMLSCMFSGNFTLVYDNEGYVFIDRDGKWFNLILNFLRDGKIEIPKDPLDYAQLIIEIEYYCFNEMLEYIYNRLHGRESFENTTNDSSS